MQFFRSACFFSIFTYGRNTFPMFLLCTVQWFEYSVYLLILVNGAILIAQTYIMDKTTQKQAQMQSSTCLEVDVKFQWICSETKRTQTEVTPPSTLDIVQNIHTTNFLRQKINLDDECGLRCPICRSISIPKTVYT